MTIQSYTMGPGLLTLGTGPLDVSCQVKAFKVSATEKVKSTDPIPMLCGEDLETPDTVSLDWMAEGTILQDLAAAGVVAYSWTNALDEVAFTFVPSTSADRKVAGVLRVVPITVGGTAGTLPDSPVKWTVIGTPTLGDATP